MMNFTIQRYDVSTITVQAESEEEAIEIAAAQSWGWEFEEGKLIVTNIEGENG